MATFDAVGDFQTYPHLFFVCVLSVSQNVGMLLEINCISTLEPTVVVFNAA